MQTRVELFDYFSNMLCSIRFMHTPFFKHENKLFGEQISRFTLKFFCITKIVYKL